MLRQAGQIVGRFDAAHEIEMLRCLSENFKLKPSVGEENPARQRAQRCHSLLGSVHLLPPVAGLALPAGPGENRQRNTRCSAGSAGMGRHLAGKRMGGINHCGDVVLDEIIAKPGNAAKTAAAPGEGRKDRALRAPGQRQHRHDGAAPGQGLAELTGLRSAAENQEAHGMSQGRRA